METEVRSALNLQFDIACQLLDIHFSELKIDECMWRPAKKGLHVVKKSGVWQADWPECENYDIGPASIAWISWHIIYWWSMVLDHSFGEGKLTRANVFWPGSVEETTSKVYQLRDEWRERVDKLSNEDLKSNEFTQWPFKDRPFYELVAWLNVELTKNVSEIGYCRFLYASNFPNKNQT